MALVIGSDSIEFRNSAWKISTCFAVALYFQHMRRRERDQEVTEANGSVNKLLRSPVSVRFDELRQGTKGGSSHDEW